MPSIPQVVGGSGWAAVPPTCAGSEAMAARFASFEIPRFVRPRQGEVRGKPNHLEERGDVLAALTGLLWIVKLPYDLPIGIDLECAPVVRLGDEGVAIGQSLRRSTRLAEDGGRRRASVRPARGPGRGIELDHAGLVGAPQVVEKQQVPVRKVLAREATLVNRIRLDL